MFESLIEQARHQWLNVGSVVFLLALIPIRNWLRTRALEKVKKKFSDDEYIVYEPKLSPLIEYYVPFLFGGISLELFLNHNDIPIILFIRISCVITLLLILLLSLYKKYLITNKKFYVIATLNLGYSFDRLFNYLGIKLFELSFSDIKSINVETSSLGSVGLVIEVKSGDKVPKLFVENINEIKSVIDNQILELSNLMK